MLLCAAAFAGPVEEVAGAEQARRAALLARDTAALNALLADDLRYVHATGRVESKADFVGGIVTGQTAYERFELSNLVIRPVTSDVVVVSGAIDQRKLSRGKWADQKLLFQAVWRHEGGAWRQAALQTVIPPPPAG